MGCHWQSVSCKMNLVEVQMNKENDGTIIGVCLITCLAIGFTFVVAKLSQSKE